MATKRNTTAFAVGFSDSLRPRSVDEDDAGGGMPGDVVTVYEDPVTREKPEGRAELRRLLSSMDEGSYVLERWVVRFMGDDPRDTYERFVRFDGDGHRG